jgi:hypothetical protein
MKIDVHNMLSWGQYVHWAELNFRRYLECSESTTTSEFLGSVAHWLAAEYVVLEGWCEIGGSDPVIDEILRAYHDHCDILRRCRNAVYHYQKEILDKRIRACATNRDEELSFAGALHFEFQRFLLEYPSSFGGTREDIATLREELSGCIGWFPDKSAIGRVWRVKEGLLELMERVGEDSTELAKHIQTEVASSLDRVSRIDFTPLTSRLSRLQRP